MHHTGHGGDVYGLRHDILDFSANTNPLGLPSGVRQALAQDIFHWERYPDPLCRDLIAAIAQHEALCSRFVFPGNGAADLIFRLAQAARPRVALIVAPTFSEYANALHSVCCDVRLHMLSPDDDYLLTREILNKLTPELDMLCLCSPNNPTGQPIDRLLLLEILDTCAQNDTILLLDECFLPFLDEPDAYTMKDVLSGFPNLVILRAFTKLYAMAGLRLGYMLCSNASLVDKIRACGQPWSVSAPAQTAGIAALADVDYLMHTRTLISAQRAYLKASLTALGLRVIGSHANYVFFESTRADLREQLLQRGILIRSCANFDGLNAQYYRVAVRTQQDNQKLCEALEAVLREEDAV